MSSFCVSLLKNQVQRSAILLRSQVENAKCWRRQFNFSNNVGIIILSQHRRKSGFSSPPGKSSVDCVTTKKLWVGQGSLLFSQASGERCSTTERLMRENDFKRRREERWSISSRLVICAVQTYAWWSCKVSSIASPYQNHAMSACVLSLRQFS